MLLIEKKTRKSVTQSVSYSIFILEGGFIIKIITDEDEEIQAYHLRHRVFCQELDWVSQSENALETDEYDDNAIFFGVFNQSKLVAFIRLILPEKSFMMEKSFSLLVGSDHKIRKENDTVEVSRLCISPETRKDMYFGNFGVYNISMFIYKGVYHWCIRNNIRYLYLVVEYKIYRLLCAKGFPCKRIGEPKTMPDGVVAVAAIMDWRDFEIFNTERRPEMLKWFTQYQSIPFEKQLLQHEACLQHQAFA